MPDYSNLSDGTSITILALNEGAWGNSLWVRLHDFDDSSGVYSITVYVKQNIHYVEIESWRVTNTYKKDGFGRQLYAEEKINGKSEYITVVVNQHSSARSMPLHTIQGEFVLFDGELQKVFESPSFTLIPGSLEIKSNDPGQFLIFDSGKGSLSGPGGAGTIDYATGEYTIAFAFGNSGTATYQYESFLQLTGGSDGDSPTASDYINALELYSDKDDLAFEFLVESQYLNDTYQEALVKLCSNREDCIALLTVPNYDDIRDLLIWRKASTINSSYAVLFSPQVQIKDEGVLVNISSSAPVASTYAENTDNNGPWSAVAGVENSGIPCIGTSKRYTEDELLLLIENQINPIVPHYDEGAIIFSQITALKTSGPLQDVHVRRLLIYIRRAAVGYLRSKTFKTNTTDLREEVSLQLSQFLAIIQANGGLASYRVVCDGTNNTRAVIDANELRVDLYAVPHDVVSNIHITLASDGRNVSTVIDFSS